MSYLTGDTIRFVSEFYGFDTPDTLVDPDEVKFIIYDDSYNQIEDITLDATSNKVEDGVYKNYYEFNNAGHYVVEIKGLFNNMPSLKRYSIDVENYPHKGSRY